MAARIEIDFKWSEGLCPYCGTPDIEEIDFSWHEDGYYSRKMRCCDCGRDFIEWYESWFDGELMTETLMLDEVTDRNGRVLKKGVSDG